VYPETSISLFLIKLVLCSRAGVEHAVFSLVRFLILFPEFLKQPENRMDGTFSPRQGETGNNVERNSEVV